MEDAVGGVLVDKSRLAKEVSYIAFHPECFGVRLYLLHYYSGPPIFFVASILEDILYQQRPRLPRSQHMHLFCLEDKVIGVEHKA